jgi:hypothetical protein
VEITAPALARVLPLTAQAVLIPIQEILTVPIQDPVPRVLLTLVVVVKQAVPEEEDNFQVFSENSF